MNQMKKEELEITISDSDRIECAIRHIQTAVDVDPWAVDIAVEAMKTQLSAKGTTSDLISRQEAIDAECEVCQIAPKKERGHNCTYYVHGCKEIECLRELPSAQPEPLVKESRTLVKDLVKDTISRRAAIDAIGKCTDIYVNNLSTMVDKAEVYKALNEVPPAEQIVRCKDCKYRGGLSGFYCDNMERAVGVDSFCSWAERRTNE